MKKFSILLFTFFSLGIGTTSAQFKVLLNFNDTNGSEPNGTLVFSGSKLYGMTFAGGAHDSGCIFSIDTNGSDYKDLFDFNISTIGYQPLGSLAISGNKLFGMTSGQGYKGNYGTIFSIDTNGNEYKVLVKFNGANGSNPNGSLTISGPTLYGMTSYGSTGFGNIFSIDTSGNGYKILFDFHNDKKGSTPLGSLIISNGVLYGMTWAGGIDTDGNVFSIDTNGSGFKDLFDFHGVDGKWPTGDVTLSGNVLYGMTQYGGIYKDGNVFSVDTNGSGFKDLEDFKGGVWGAYEPRGDLTLYGSLLYGMTLKGGANGWGNIFSIDTNGSEYKDLSDTISTGIEPFGSLTLVGNKLYGMTSQGGLSGGGIIFRYNNTFPCVNKYNQPICIVTTDTALNKNVIIWGRNDSPPDGSFNIYDSTSSGWTLIGNLPDTALSEYIDTASKPNTQSYSYRISTVDSCGESALSPFNSTIYLQVLQESAGRDSLFWAPYVGFTTPYYLIYRGLSLNTLTLIDSVTGSIQSFVDTLPPAGSIYLVEAINPLGGCTPTKRFIHGSSTNTYASISNGGVPKKVTGIANITYPKNAITISPNPNNGKFSVQLGMRNEQLGIKIYNVFGQEVYSTPLNLPQGRDFEIDLTNHASGVYFFRVFTETGNLVSEGKFIKK